MTQQFFPGQEPPARDPEIEQAIEAKYERLTALKLAREAASISDAKLLELVEARGAPYAFNEPGTGKRKILRLDAKKRLLSQRAKSAKAEQADREWEAAQQEHRGGDQQDAGREQWEQEVERRRATATAPSDDPFASTRSALPDETPAQAAAREAETARAQRRNKRAQQ